MHFPNIFSTNFLPIEILQTQSKRKDRDIQILECIMKSSGMFRDASSRSLGRAYRLNMETLQRCGQEANPAKFNGKTSEFALRYGWSRF